MNHKQRLNRIQQLETEIESLPFMDSDALTRSAFRAVKRFLGVLNGYHSVFIQHPTTFFLSESCRVWLATSQTCARAHIAELATRDIHNPADVRDLEALYSSQDSILERLLSLPSEKPISPVRPHQPWHHHRSRPKRQRGSFSKRKSE